MENRTFIPVCEPYLAGNEKKYVMEALDTGWISSAGSFLNQFETKFAEYCGTKYATTTSNGTTALHLAFRALGVGPGDEVIIPNFTMVASLMSVLYTGATPVFVDVEPDTLNIDPKLIANKITSRTKALMPVHIWGHPVDMDPVRALCDKHNIAIVEDAAEAHGATYRGIKCGALGTIACFSFFANKLITTGEGGMVTTDSEELYKKCRYFKNLCFKPDKRDYIHNDLGYNFRMTNLQAAVGVAQLEKIEDYIGARRNNARIYTEILSRIPGLIFHKERPECRTVNWMYGIMLDPKVIKKSREEVLAKLSSMGIDHRIYFQPMHSQPLLKEFKINDTGSYPVTEFAAKNGFYLPSSSNLSSSQIEFICDGVAKALT